MTNDEYVKKVISLMTEGIKGGLSLEKLNYLTVLAVQLAAADRCKRNSEKDDIDALATALSLSEALSILEVLANDNG